MAGNWAQHAFVDASAPEDPLKSSITCINTRYNRRCFNDGYHIGHHVLATRHYSEMPADFLKSIPEYIAKDAIIFDGIDFFQVWVLLMLKQHRALAKRVLRLGAPKTDDEVIALLRSRLRPCASN